MTREPSESEPIVPAPDNRVLIFANPIAGRGIGIEIARQLERRFRADGIDVRNFAQRPPEISKDELQGPARAVVVIGGDGTLRGVAQRLVEANAVAPLLPVPLGTANLMGRHLGFHWKLSSVVSQVSAAVARLQIRYLDAGRLNGRIFLLMAGVGFDAQVVHHLDRIRRGPIQLWDYLLPTALSFLTYPADPLRVRVDDAEVFPEQNAIAFIGNLAEYGTGFPIVPFARADDGLLDVCVLPCHSQVDLIRLFLLAAAGEHVQSEGVVYCRGKQVRVESPAKVLVQVDGDPAGTTPLSADLLPIRLPFIVP